MFNERCFFRKQCASNYQLTTIGKAEGNFRLTSVYRDAVVLFINRSRLWPNAFICSQQSRPLDICPPYANIPRHVDRGANSVSDEFDVFYDENRAPSRHFLHTVASTAIFLHDRQTKTTNMATHSATAWLSYELRQEFRNWVCKKNNVGVGRLLTA